MRCPHCFFEGNTVDGKCRRCGYDIAQVAARSTSLTTIRPAIPPQGTRGYTLSRGDTLQEGRYRLIAEIPLPENQKKQGTAWSALDLQKSHRHVVIREIIVPPDMARASSSDRVAYAAAHHLTELGHRKGFSMVIDFFRDRRSYFLVFLYPEGESLLSLLQRQGGALPEDIVVDYGAQICGLLALLAEQQPPIVHGSINPETIIISADRRSASLIHLPLFPPSPMPSGPDKVSSGYYAPEQMRGEVGTSADLYGLAVSMHHAVTGYDPHTRLALFHPPVRRLNPAATAQMEMILSRQLCLSVSQRYPHPSDMQKDLLALLDSNSRPVSSGRLSVAAVEPILMDGPESDNHSREGIALNIAVFVGIVILLVVGLLFAVLRF